ncbi:MAG: phage virion morphogenesis protein [Azoarcus sp.]|nr:phage virion morphogenesis protein [Azoarcus sp.]
MSIDVEFDNEQVLEVLRRVMARFTPAGMRPAMKEIGEALAASTKQRFDTSAAPDGSPWPALKPGTVLARYRKMMGGLGRSHFKKDSGLTKRGVVTEARVGAASEKPLVKSNPGTTLRDTIHYQITDGGAGVAIGTNRFAGEWEGGAAVHQFGSRNGRIPARSFLGLSEEDDRTVLDILKEMLLG